ncbi:MAG: hypothetical protein REI09_06585, partial [Candidatus Dactylopiibacterium sp.]|nr:hypothetical protein [Candidatus Dactylopiibacterium sp.]
SVAPVAEVPAEVSATRATPAPAEPANPPAAMPAGFRPLTADEARVALRLALWRALPAEWPPLETPLRVVCEFPAAGRARLRVVSAGPEAGAWILLLEAAVAGLTLPEPLRESGTELSLEFLP